MDCQACDDFNLRSDIGCTPAVTSLRPDSHIANQSDNIGQSIQTQPQRQKLTIRLRPFFGRCNSMPAESMTSPVIITPPQVDSIRKNSLCRLDSCPGDLAAMDNTSVTITPSLQVPSGLPKAKSSDNLLSPFATSELLSSFSSGVGDGSACSSRAASPTSTFSESCSPSKDLSSSPLTRPQFLSNLFTMKGFDGASDGNQTIPKKEPPSPALRRMKVKNRDVNSWAPGSF